MDPSLHNPSNVFSSLPIDHSSPKKKDSYRATNPISGSRLHINNTSGNTAPSMYNQLMDTDRRSHETTDVSIGRNQFVSSQSPRELAQRGLDDMALTQIGLPSSAMSSNGESYMDSQHVNNSNDNSNNNNTPFTSGIVTGNREEALLESSRSPVARPQLYDMNGAAYKEVEGSAQLAAGQIVDRQDDYPIYYPADASRPVAHHNTINMETSPSELLSNNDRNGDTPWPIRYTSSSHYPPPRIDTSVYYHPSSVGQEELVGDDARLGSAYMSAARRNYYSNSPIPPESSRNGWHSSPVARPPHALPEHCICCGMMAPQFNSGESFDPALLCQNCQDLWLDVGVRCMTCSWIPSREDTERLSYCPRCHAPGWSLDPTVGVERAHRLSSRSRYSYPYPPRSTLISPVVSRYPPPTSSVDYVLSSPRRSSCTGRVDNMPTTPRLVCFSCGDYLTIESLTKGNGIDGQMWGDNAVLCERCRARWRRHFRHCTRCCYVPSEAELRHHRASCPRCTMGNWADDLQASDTNDIDEEYEEQSKSKIVSDDATSSSGKHRLQDESKSRRAYRNGSNAQIIRKNSDQRDKSMSTTSARRSLGHRRSSSHSQVSESTLNEQAARSLDSRRRVKQPITNGRTKQARMSKPDKSRRRNTRNSISDNMSEEESEGEAEETEEESIEDSDVKMEEGDQMIDDDDDDDDDVSHEETDNNSDYVNEEESNYNEDRKFVNRENTSDDETITLGRQIREQQRLLGNTTKPISSSNRRSSLSSNHSTELGKSSSKRSSAQPESESKRARNNNVEDEHDEDTSVTLDANGQNVDAQRTSSTHQGTGTLDAKDTTRSHTGRDGSTPATSGRRARHSAGAQRKKGCSLAKGAEQPSNRRVRRAPAAPPAPAPVVKPERPVRLSARRGQPSCQSCTEALTPSELENNEAQLCKKCMTRYGHHHFRCTACQYIPTMLELKSSRCTRCAGGTWLLDVDAALSDPKAVTSMKSRTKNLRKPGDIVARVAPPTYYDMEDVVEEAKTSETKPDTTKKESEDENVGEGNHDDENKEEEGKVKEESNDASTQVESTPEDGGTSSLASSKDESHIRNNPIIISSNETNPSSSDDSSNEEEEDKEEEKHDKDEEEDDEGDANYNGEANDDEKDANNDSNPDDSNTNMEYTSSPTESNFTANASTGSMSGNNTLHSDAMEPESTSQYDEQELLDNNDDSGEDNEISGNSLHKSNITNAYTESSTSSEVIVPMENNHNNCNNTTRRSRQRECDSCPTKLSSTIGRAIDNLLLCNDCYERYRGHFSRCTACSYIPTTMELLKKFCTRCHGGTWLVVIQPVSISSNDNNSNNNTASANNTTQSQDGDKSNSSKTSTTKRRRRSTKFIFVNNTITRPITSYFDKVPAPIERPLEVGCNGDTMETELPGSDKEMITSTDCH